MSRLSAKPTEHFHESKVFEVYDPSATNVLTDENGVPFTVELYAPQSKYMMDFDEKKSRHDLFMSAKTNGASEQNYDAKKMAGAVRIAHAIKSWHPVGLDGKAITEEELPFNERAIAETLLDPAVLWWLTDQLAGFFRKEGFVVQNPGTEIISDTTKPAKPMKIAS